MSVPNGGGSPLRREEERGGSIVLDSMSETSVNDVWTLVSVASYWLQVVTRPPRLPEDGAWIFPHGRFYSIGGGHCTFLLEIPLSG